MAARQLKTSCRAASRHEHRPITADLRRSHHSSIAPIEALTISREKTCAVLQEL